jgi:hypothetical protein
MIDFRYHLVSLVSVFLALAVGIVLGAGPLKGEIGNQLTTQVQNLRADAQNLRTQLETSQGAVNNRDTFVRTVLPSLAAEQLTGRSIVLVLVPGADTDAVDPLVQALQDAGASISGQVTVKDAWTDPGKAADRQSALKSLQPLAASGASASGASASAASASGSAAPAVAGAGLVTVAPRVQVLTAATPGVTGADPTMTALAGVLSRALVSTDPAQVGRSDSTSTGLVEGLAKAGLIGVDRQLRGRAGEAVVLVPGVQAAVGGQQPSPSGSAAVDTTAQWSTLAATLDVDGSGTVVVGPASSATSGGVIAKIRGQDAVTKIVSTIDTGGTPMGDLTTVLALREQALGGVGSYGFVGKVDGPLPARSGTGKS